MFEARQEPKYHFPKTEDDLMLEKSSRECQICNQRYRFDQFSKLSDCEHEYCKDCLKYYTLHKVRNQFAIINCPKQSCKKQINKQCQTFLNLPPNLQQRYNKIIENLKFLSNPSFRICPKCEEHQLNKLKGEDNLFCTGCIMRFCPICLNPAHQKYAKCDNAVINLLKRNFEFKRCPQCLFIVQKNQGCNHMTCMCSFQFCYLCGRDWDHGRHQCPPKPKYVRPRTVRVQRREIPQRQPFKLNEINMNLVFNPERLASQQKVKNSRINQVKLPQIGQKIRSNNSIVVSQNNSLLINFVPVVPIRRKL